MPMQNFLSLPNPLARLTGLIEVVEEARTAMSTTFAAQTAGDEHVSHPDHGHEDIDHLSLSHQDMTGTGARDLEAMSLSRRERSGRGDAGRPGSFGA